MDRIRVATLNIWNKSGPWPRRLDLIRRELRELTPDIVGLQEVLQLEAPGSDLPADVFTNQAAEVADGLGYQHAYGMASDHGHGLSLGNALLSRFPIRDQRTFRLPSNETHETRAVLYALVATPAGPLPVFVTHLNWKLHQGSVRVAQVRELVRLVTELAPFDRPELLPPLLMGDFNAEPESDEIRFLKGFATIEGESVFFADAWAYGGNGSPGYTFDRRNTFAARAHEPPRRIDYIFVRGPDGKLRGEPLDTRLAWTHSQQTPEGEVWASDHFGLVTDIVLGPQFG